MILPDEIAAKSVVPAVRAIVVRKLVDDHRFTQLEAAKVLGITQPAVSKYLNNKRGIGIVLNGVREVEQATDEIVRLILTGAASKIDIMSKLQETTDFVRRNRLMCDLHKRLEPSLDINGCHICDGQTKTKSV